jgi:hypothetical protein
VELSDVAQRAMMSVEAYPKVASDGAELRPRQSNERSLDVLAAQLGSIGRLERRRCSPLDLAVHGGMC